MQYNRLNFLENKLLVPSDVDIDKLTQRMYNYFAAKTRATINSSFDKNVTQINIAFNDTIDQLTKLKLEPEVVKYKEKLSQLKDLNERSAYGQKIANQLNSAIQSIVVNATNTVKQKFHYIDFNVRHKMTWRNLVVIIAELQAFKDKLTDVKKLRQFKAQLIEAAISFSYNFNKFFDNEINWKLFSDKHREYETCIYYQLSSDYELHLVANNHHVISTLTDVDEWY